MSTAAGFRYPGRFPFCSASTNYSYGDLGNSIFIVKNLTLSDAMKLFWNLETVEVGFNLSALFGSSTHSTNFYATLPAVGYLGSERKPRDRVCYLADKRSGIAGTASVTNAVNYSGGGSDNWRHGWGFPLDDGSVNGVVPQGDGYYQYIFKYDDGVSADLAGGGGLHVAAKSVSGGGASYVDTGLSTTVSILSGSVRFNFIVSEAAFSYSGSPSLSSVTINPAYYTY